MQRGGTYQSFARVQGIFRLVCDERSLNLRIPVRQKAGLGFSRLDPRVTYLQIGLLPRLWQEEAETSELPEE